MSSADLRLLSRVLVLSLGLATCGGDDDVDSADASTPPDASAPCRVDEDCDDGAFCNGAETCDPSSPAANLRGCVPSESGPSCLDETQTCDEATDACVTLCEVTEDADGDGARAPDCGGNDCDDADPGRFPGNPELCDAEGVDEDCDPSTFGERDVDGDGLVDALCCNGETCGTDCDDLRRGTSPGATEVCNGFDDDCDGTVDEGVQVETWRDADFDLHGDMGSGMEMNCPDAFGFAIVQDDCDDGAPSVHAAQVEICDAIDNDCDGTVDESPAAVTWYVDADGDGFGSSDPEQTRVSCTPLVGYSLRPTDCDDSRAGVSPSTPERCDGLDNDCNGRPDFFVGPGDTEDDDLDGHADLACPSGDDCDDRDPWAHPEALEICDRRDNDCNDAIDDAAAMGQWWIDRDGDTFGDDDDAMVMSCTPVRGHALRAGDCDDSSELRRPGASEKCDGVDDDCDGEVDEGSAREAFYLDEDGDGLGAGAPVLACERPIDRVANAGDCDDASRSVGAASLYFVDADDDGWGDPGRSELACAPVPDRIDRGGDCDDGSDAIFPMSVEICGGADEDCDGAIDEDPAASASCSLPGAVAACVEGGCAVAECDPGFGDCDGTGGCETSLVDDPMNCGMCGRMCAAGERCRQDRCARVVELAAGSVFACARFGEGEVSCWGNSGFGQLGRGDTVPSDTPSAGREGLVRLHTGEVLADAVQIATFPNGATACAVRAGGAVACWGENDNGQCGANAPPGRALLAYPIPGIGDAVEVRLGVDHACARSGDGTVRCWGDNAQGQLMSGSLTPAQSAMPLPAVETTMAGACPSTMPITDAIALAAGTYTTCVLRAGGMRVTCAGNGSGGVLGRGEIAGGSYPCGDDVLLPDGTSGTALVTSTGPQSFGVTGDGVTCLYGVGAPVCWGSNGAARPLGGSDNQVYIPRAFEPLRFAEATAMAGGFQTLYVTYANPTFGPRVASSGSNQFDQLGSGPTPTASAPADLRLPEADTFVEEHPQQVVGGQHYACALLQDGAVTCWGQRRELFPGARDTVDPSARIPNLP